MPRPRSRRRVREFPGVTYYKPQGVPLRQLQSEILSHEEWESLRLRYDENLDQHNIAKKMQTSQSSVQRILSGAQRKMASAIIQGKAIKIHTEKT